MRAEREPCWQQPGWTAEQRRIESLLAGDRSLVMMIRSIAWMNAHVTGHAKAREVVRTWKRRIQVYDAWSARNAQKLPEDPRSFRTSINLPALLGGASVDGGGLVYGLRPELVFASLDPRRFCAGSELTCLENSWGVGPYGELLEASGHRVLGAGATLVRYGSRYTVAPSIGRTT